MAVFSLVLILGGTSEKNHPVFLWIQRSAQRLPKNLSSPRFFKLYTFFYLINLYLFLYFRLICVFASVSGFTDCSLHSSPHQPAFSGKAYRSALTVSRSLFIIDFHPLQKYFLALFSNLHPVFLYWNEIIMNEITSREKLIFGNFRKKIISIWKIRNKFYFRGGLIWRREGYYGRNSA